MAQAKVDHNVNRYPEIGKVIRKVLQERDFPTGEVQKLEITCLQNGEATWRVWAPGFDEPEGGVYSQV
jgi:hypothetical protein